MQKNDKQLGTPFVDYTDTKSAIEALTGMRIGAHAVSTDNPSAPFGVYVGSGWLWYATGSSGGVSTHNSLSGLQGGTGSQYYHLGYNEWGGLVTGSLTRLHQHSAIDIVTGTLSPQRLASGTYNNSTVLFGDQNFRTPSGLFTFVSDSNEFFRVDNSGNSMFSGTIATLPGGATLTYNVVAGNENAMVPFSTSNLAKMRLYNTTRGTNANISNCNTTTNTITLTANVPAGWQIGDAITIASQTVASGLNHCDFEVTSGACLNQGGVLVALTWVESSAGITMRLHPFESYAASKQFNIVNQVASVNFNITTFIKLTNNVFSMAWNSSGVSSATVVLRLVGYVTP